MAKRKIYLWCIRTETEGVLYVDGWSSSDAPGTIPYEIEEDHPFFRSPGKYRLDNDELIYDNSRWEKDLEEEKKRQEAEKRRQEILKNIEKIFKEKDDETAGLKEKVEMLSKMNEDYIVLISELLSELGKNPLDDPPANDGGGEVPIEEEA
ncbi:hypothetical protein [Bacillus phage phiAGATE]|uniref:Uncharacterized protein n=1 Tax=Bacillus phage phiAGATE TaxID=1204533 RepID=L0LA67_9CAUD|nr:hypothetical protein G380_gp141 [Bacillus phage phiAGATE]AGB62587.1 hypothetical protein [Bacillus phage phiAGATE]